MSVQQLLISVRSHWFCSPKQYWLLDFPPNTPAAGASSKGELLSLKTVVSSSSYDCEEKLEGDLKDSYAIK